MTSSSSAPSILSAEKILQLIRSDGLLCRVLKGFEARITQQNMTSDVIDAYNLNRIALIEAGTGTGKSLAYLLPAILWASIANERTVISTNTINLQEQLVNKDIPQLLDALNINIKAVLVKGMNNYLCIRKLEDAQSELVLFPGEEKNELDRIDMWRRNTSGGSKSEIPFVPSPGVWERVGAESEACAGTDCPRYQECFFFKARRQAQEAHLLVVNHHLLFADISRRAEKNNYSDVSVLPAYKRIILDEAHHIEEVATEYFANKLHRIELIRILSGSSDKQHSSEGKFSVLKEKLHSVFKSPAPREISLIIGRLTVDLPAGRLHLIEQIHRTFDLFGEFIDCIRSFPESAENGDNISLTEKKLRLLKEHRTHPKWTGEILPQANQLAETLERYSQSLKSLETDLKSVENERLNEQTKNVRMDIHALSAHIETAIATLNHFLADREDSARVRWIELRKLKNLTNVHLVDAQLDISKALVEFMFEKFPTVILCSATLTSNKSFSFIRRRLGLTPNLLPGRQITESTYESPFDYRKQALLAVPVDMPLPSHPDFNAHAYENIWNAIESSRGQAFVLFTSYQMLQNCYLALKNRLTAGRYPVFKQGDESRRKLLNRFKSSERAVLFGTDSFWEGVDVAGDALRCVIIVKLPFKVPNEPIIQARTEAILERGGDPFFEFSVPHAVVKFKQGFGRLIRHQSDRGCIVCLDARLITKGYGKIFLDSLPNCQTHFLKSNDLWPKITEFYRKTYYLVCRNPFSAAGKR